MSRTTLSLSDDLWRPINVADYLPAVKEAAKRGIEPSAHWLVSPSGTSASPTGCVLLQRANWNIYLLDNWEDFITDEDWIAEMAASDVIEDGGSKKVGAIKEAFTWHTARFCWRSHLVSSIVELTTATLDDL